MSFKVLFLLAVLLITVTIVVVTVIMQNHVKKITELWHSFTKSSTNGLMDKWTQIINEQRGFILSKSLTLPWIPVVKSAISLNHLENNYLEKVNNPAFKSYINMTVIYINVKEMTILLPSVFYDHTAKNCSLLYRHTRHGDDDYGAKCYNLNNSNWNTSDPRWLEPHSVNTRKSAFSLGMVKPLANRTNFYKMTRLPATFFHVIRDGIVIEDGDVYCKNTRVLPQRCVQGISQHPGNGSDLLMVDELVSISQTFATTFYHFTVENLPRLALFVQFLKENPHVQIHVHHQPFASSFLNMLGINPDGRIVKGKVRARIIYLPAGVPCMRPTLFSTNIISVLLRQSLQPKPARNAIVLIRRKDGRQFIHRISIEKMLRSEAETRGLQVFVHYPDTRAPSISESRVLYNSAVMIVAPHGAGLANMLFCEPGTVVIEAIHTRRYLCFRNQALLLGHHYHGVYVPVIGFTTVADLLPGVKHYLDNVIMPRRSKEH